MMRAMFHISIFAVASVLSFSSVSYAEPGTEDHAPQAEDAVAPVDDAPHAAEAADPADENAAKTDAHGDDHGDAHKADAHGDDHGAGHGDDHGVPWSGIIQHAWNLTVLLLVLFFAARRPIGDALRGRGLSIRTDLADAARERDEALQRQAELDARLSRFEAEVAAMKDAANSDAGAEHDKLMKRAQDAAERIAETAQRNIRDEVVRAQVALRNDAVDLAVQLAEDALKGNIKADDHRRLARQFLESLDD